ncbi:MAG: Gfo/Idh/MocA family oxidoreductase [Planctomycetota bacterium]
MSFKPVSVAVIGCGNISGIYFTNCKRMESLKVTACADLDRSRAAARAKEFGIPRVLTVDQVMADPEIELILNLTVPKAHYSVAKRAVMAGKSVYNEKPLTLTPAEGRTLLKLAAKKRVLVGGAPDTFLGAGHQACRAIIDSGEIGTPVAATAFMMCHGHESWHPSPEFHYEVGGGPMLDMGPYYVTALVNMLGPVRRVTGSARISFPKRTITSEPKHGKVIKVATPTHLAAVLDFRSGAIATLVTSFDVWAHTHSCIEIYGSEGSLRVPDPNGFGGDVLIKKPGDQEWKLVEYSRPYAENSRGVGVADLACSIRRRSRKHRASGTLTFHVLEVMSAVHAASKAGRHKLITSTCNLPAPVPEDVPFGQLDA